jgi:hypothetical protein
VGRHLHDPAHGRAAAGRPDQWRVGRPLRRPALRHRGVAARGGHLHCAHDAARRHNAVRAQAWPAPSIHRPRCSPSASSSA